MPLFFQPATNEGNEFASQIMASALHGPQKHAFDYFKDYFANGGTAKHPILGDLNEVAEKIERFYGDDKGTNLVSGLIRYEIEKQSTNPSPSP